MTVSPPQDTRFHSLADQHRRELLAHCYRMMGSAQDAEDQLQETLLRAWRGLGDFEGRSSERTWLYRIATNTCLTALEARGRRPLPTGLGAPDSAASAELVERGEVAWLGPLPGDGGGADPAAVAVSRESLRLAFVAALQHLSARERAVLILREVLQWRAAEVADALEMTPVAVNSMLARARKKMRAVDAGPARLADPTSAQTRASVERYMAAFESYDIDALVGMLTGDAIWEMPPFDSWYSGAGTIVELIRVRCPANGPGDMRMVPTTANGQPAVALYMRDGDGAHRAFNLQVLGMADGRVHHVVVFFDLELFERFGLPAVAGATGAARPQGPST